MKQKWVLLRSLFPTTDDLIGTLVKENVTDKNNTSLVEIDLDKEIVYARNHETGESVEIPLSKALIVSD